MSDKVKGKSMPLVIKVYVLVLILIPVCWSLGWILGFLSITGSNNATLFSDLCFGMILAGIISFIAALIVAVLIGYAAPRFDKQPEMAALTGIVVFIVVILFWNPLLGATINGVENVSFGGLELVVKALQGFLTNK